MEAILKIQTEVNDEASIGVFKAVTDDADMVLYPVLVNGKYYHLRKLNNGRWDAIGLGEELTLITLEKLLIKKCYTVRAI
jgi:hypothetical protein